MMYQTFETTPACFRRLNGTHQFGCSSPRGGNYGVIHFIRNDTDLRDFLRNGVAGPYAVVLSPLLFKRNIVDSLVNSDKVSGIVLNTALTPDIEPVPSSYSPVKNTCDVEWNPAANNFLFHDWPVPVFLLNQIEDYTAIANCHDRFNPPLDETQLSRPLCSLHLRSHMHAAVNSEVCLRRINYYGVKPIKYCDPVGDRNVILPSLQWNGNDTRNVIMVGARMDALSLFDGIAPGAMSSVTGLVTLLNTAYIFHRMIEQNDSKANNDIGVIFTLFNGEAYDFIGSSRVVYDMNQGLFPSVDNKLDIQNIRLFIELFQLNSNRKVYVHHTADKEVTDFLNYLNSTTSSVEVSFKDSNLNVLPPTSFQSFYKANNNISGAILSNMKDSFVDNYFNSIYDTAKYVDYVYGNGSISEKTPIYNLQYRLNDISLVIASYLYKKAFNREAPVLPEPNKSVELIDELLHCYIETRKCRLMDEVGAGASNKLPDLLPMYVGVVKNPENYLSMVTRFILAYLTGKKLDISRENCVNDETQRDYSLYWMKGKTGNGECINSSVILTPAESPAFFIENYNWNSGLYSTWTESVWTKTTLGLFIKPFRIQEIIVLLVGLIVLLVSFTSVYFFNKKSDLIFISNTPTSC
ncbi:hypothetical protein O3M35_001360 [Rhynocoris fuscipes]|uniref:Nicastrin n=1 Tax=Rhynocoris fuscipes TaxID=488301 RepID=A0AAW1DU68_9HEMI